MAGVFAWAYTGFTNVVVGRRTKALLSQRVNGEQASQRALSGPGDQIYDDGPCYHERNKISQFLSLPTAAEISCAS